MQPGFVVLQKHIPEGLGGYPISRQLKLESVFFRPRLLDYAPLAGMELETSWSTTSELSRSKLGGCFELAQEPTEITTLALLL